MCPTPIPAPIRVSEFFSYRGGELHAEEVAVSRIATVVGTPFYLYSAAAFAAQYRRFAEAFSVERPLICYAVKANSNLAVLRLFADLGAGADVVSEGELRRLSELANTRGRVVPVAIRVNPDVDARTHAKLSTGMKENKFGIDVGEAIDAYRLGAELPGIEPVGLAVHIGSQLVDLEPYRRAFARVAGLVRELCSAGLPVSRIDLGGGLGIRYRDEHPPDPESYARLVGEVFGAAGLTMSFEPGRVLAGPAGLLLVRVIYVKQGAAKRFVIVDGAMNDLIRPALYDAWHEIMLVRRPAAGVSLSPADVVGPVCEPGDAFAVDRELPPIADGDLLALTAAGAYGAVMSSTYNSRPLVPEVLVAGSRFDVIRARPSYDDMLSLDTIPPWLSEVGPVPARKRGVR